jgi:large repetitive protein
LTAGGKLDMSAQAGVPYTATLVATGGSGPYKWKLISSALPKGLKLNKKTGTIAGKAKATAVGTDSFEVQVSSGSEKITADFSISVT